MSLYPGKKSSRKVRDKDKKKKKKEKKDKKKNKNRSASDGRSNSKGSGIGNPFDEDDGDSNYGRALPSFNGLDSEESSEFESAGGQADVSATTTSSSPPVPRSEPLPVELVGGRRTSVGTHRPKPLPRSANFTSGSGVASPEVHDRSFQEPDTHYFHTGLVRSRSSSTVSMGRSSSAAAAAATAALGYSDDEHSSSSAPGASPRRLTERTKTKLFTPKATYLEQDERLTRLERVATENQEKLAEMSKHVNMLSSVQKSMSFRIVTLLDMLGEISRGAQYTMKDTRSIPYQVTPPVDKRPKPPPGLFDCLFSSSGGGGEYEAIGDEDEDDRGSHAEGDHFATVDIPEEDKCGCSCSPF